MWRNLKFPYTSRNFRFFDIFGNLKFCHMTFLHRSHRWYRWQIWGMCQLYICAFYTPIPLKNVQDKFFLVLCNWENSIKRTKTASSGGVTQAVWNSANRVVPDGWLWHLWADQGSARLTSPAAQYRPNKPELQFNAQLQRRKVCPQIYLVQWQNMFISWLGDALEFFYGIIWKFFPNCGPPPPPPLWEPLNSKTFRFYFAF